MLFRSGDSIRYDRFAMHDQGFECFALVGDATIENTLVPKEGEAFAQILSQMVSFRCKCYRPYQYPTIHGPIDVSYQIGLAPAIFWLLRNALPFDLKFVSSKTGFSSANLACTGIR